MRTKSLPASGKTDTAESGMRSQNPLQLPAKQAAENPLQFLTAFATKNIVARPVQRVFNKDAVEAAILHATNAMYNMGGTTGGAYHLVTNSADREVRELVIKVSGRSSAVLAANIYNSLGIPAPKAVMLPVSTPLINKLGRLAGVVPGKFASQASIEVQQHTNSATLQEGGMPTSPEGRKAMVLAGDTLTGNHDRIHSRNEENFSGGFAIDNVVHEDGGSTEEMMLAAKGILDTAAVVNAQIKKITGAGNGTDTSKIEQLKTQKAFLTGLQQIGSRADAVTELIDAANADEDADARAMVIRLTAMSKSKEALPDEPLEATIREVCAYAKLSREVVIANNLSTYKSKIGTEHHPGLKSRLALIRKWHDELNISDALTIIEDEIVAVTEALRRNRQEWSEGRNTERIEAGRTFEHKGFWDKLFSNKANFIAEALRGWDASHPEPR